jgi:ketosteroid isomerase-like protein
MSTQDNLQLIDDWLAAVNERDLDRWLAMHDAEVVWHLMDHGNVLQGHEQTRAAINSFIGRQPDVRWDKVDAFGQGQMVCLEMTEKGTEAESGEPVAFYIALILRIEGGKVAEVHRYGVKR